MTTVRTVAGVAGAVDGDAAAAAGAEAGARVPREGEGARSCGDCGDFGGLAAAERVGVGEAAGGVCGGVPCVVALSLVAADPASEPLVWSTGPLSPGLCMRTVTTMFPASSCVAVALELACWPVEAD